jgi:copper(I)-binding protein
MKLIAVMALALIAAPPVLAQTAPSSTLEVQQVWARATPAGAKTGAIYLTVVNHTGADDKLVAASTPEAREAQLHTMIDDNGVMKMRQLPSIEIKAGATVTLKPGGMHVMLLGLKEPLKQGASFPLTLQFEKGGKRELTVSVSKAGAMGMDGMDHMGGMGNMPGNDMSGHGMGGKQN